MELFFAIAALAAAVGAVARHSIVAGRARAARSAARTTIAQAPEGRRARIVGTILDGEAFTAPITGRRCVYCAFTVEEYVGSQLQTWRTLASDIRGVAFTLTDRTGRALVDVDRAEVEIDPKGGLRTGTIDESTPDAMRRFAHLAQSGAIFKQRLRYREAALAVGETVAVVGVAVREPDPDAIADVSGYREGPPTRLRLGSTPSQRLLISDAPSEVEVD